MGGNKDLRRAKHEAYQKKQGQVLNRSAKI